MRFTGPLIAALTSLTVLAAGAKTTEPEGEHSASKIERVDSGSGKIRGGAFEMPVKPSSGKPSFGGSAVRRTWDECVGMSGEDAVAHIRQARPELRKIVIVREGSMVTMDMRMDRVRVWCNEDGIVTRPPRVG